MALLTIGTTDFAGVSEYEVYRKSIDGEGTGRDESGLLTRQLITTKYTIRAVCRIPASSLDDYATAFAPASLSVTFLDPYVADTSTTATMYIGDRTAKLVQLKTGSETASYWDLSFELIEF
jgi:hypothetical protein